MWLQILFVKKTGQFCFYYVDGYIEENYNVNAINTALEYDFEYVEEKITDKYIDDEFMVGKYQKYRIIITSCSHF